MEDLKKFPHIKDFLLDKGWRFISVPSRRTKSSESFMYVSESWTGSESDEKGKDFFSTQDEGIALVLKNDDMFEGYCEYLKGDLEGYLNDFKHLKNIPGSEQIKRVIDWLGVQIVQQTQAKQGAACQARGAGCSKRTNGTQAQSARKVQKRGKKGKAKGK